MLTLFFAITVQFITNIPDPAQNVTQYMAVYGLDAANMNQVAVLTVASTTPPTQNLTGVLDIDLAIPTFMAVRAISSGIESDDSNVVFLGKPSALTISEVTVLTPPGP